MKILLLPGLAALPACTQTPAAAPPPPPIRVSATFENPRTIFDLPPVVMKTPHTANVHFNEGSSLAPGVIAQYRSSVIDGEPVLGGRFELQPYDVGVSTELKTFEGLSLDNTPHVIEVDEETTITITGTPIEFPSE